LCFHLSGIDTVFFFLQGCCVSRSSGPNSPYPGGAPSSSSRVINPSSTPHSAAAAPSSRPQSQTQTPATQTSSPSAAAATDASRGSRGRRRGEPRPLDQHIDKPLRRHAWTSTDRTWTRAALARERADFFDTRVTGRPEVWQTLRAALEELRDPDDPDQGLATAQTIISAAEISLPTGDLANGAYDALGSYYPLPEWIVSDPTNVVEGSDDNTADNDDDGDDDDGDAKGRVSEDTAGDVVDGRDARLDDGDSERRREKGKAILDVREQIAVRARLSENGRDYQVLVYKTDTVRTVAKKIAEQCSVRICSPRFKRP
jgi:hypothetical protein